MNDQTTCGCYEGTGKGDDPRRDREMQEFVRILMNSSAAKLSRCVRSPTSGRQCSSPATLHRRRCCWTRQYNQNGPREESSTPQQTAALKNEREKTFIMSKADGWISIEDGKELIQSVCRTSIVHREQNGERHTMVSAQRWRGVSVVDMIVAPAGRDPKRQPFFG